MTIRVPIFVLIGLLVAGCSSTPITANFKAIDCAYSGIREIALGINGHAVQHYDISDDEEICRSIFLWLDGHRHRWRVCYFTINGNLFISGKLFQVNINDSHMGILWANNMRENYRWYYRPRDDDVDALLEDIKRWIIVSSKEEVITSKNDGSIKELGAFEKAWEKIDSDTKDKIEQYLMMELGLSSTGKIELIGNYRLTEDDEFGKQGQQVLHFIQRDLFGSRLFWSCLLNVDNYNTRLLYHVNIDTNAEPINNLNHIKLHNKLLQPTSKSGPAEL